MSTMKDIATRFTEMVSNWDATDVLGALNMSEGHTLAELLEAIAAPAETVEHVLRGVWLGEEEGSRDPKPYRHKLDGYRASDTGASDVSGWDFAPRADWEEHEDAPESEATN